jgi:hypothetical protein
MEEIEIFEQHKRHKELLDTLEGEKLNVAARFIIDNPDCSTDVVAMAVEKQNA